jgi:hypothetical protein
MAAKPQGLTGYGFIKVGRIAGINAGGCSEFSIFQEGSRKKAKPAADIENR